MHQFGELKAVIMDRLWAWPAGSSPGKPGTRVCREQV